MEFRFRDGDENDPSLLHPFSSSSSLSDASLFLQRLHRGFIGVSGGDIRMARLMRPMPAFGDLRRELQKEQIRKDIIVREVLEEEVRREMDLERANWIRRMPVAEPPMIVPPPKEMVVEGLWPGTVDVGVDKGLPLQINPNRKGGEDIDLSHHKTVPESSSTTEVGLSEPEASGMKRKGTPIAGSSKLLQPSQERNWDCALCNVSTTGKVRLNDHLQGRKHKAKLALNSANNAAPEAEKIDIGEKMHWVSRKEGYLWCEHCKVKCNSRMVMAAHLSGKKHTMRMGNLDHRYDPVEAIATNAKASDDNKAENAII